ncbi:Metallo-hydrolase/oxidoreductase [Fistulina hepatica ATCC 64428]|uniref:Metallo-hydrolase/oxidoreductase n=1 Tax=Fistulina hepatica ATCC 64428 TaxID=1128425 RepID=A0A0D7AEF8_9AGAR|nr:Metallo-hydrolase/oxidoreductase [Fistulina hepatica ATCC 64428]
MSLSSRVFEPESNTAVPSGSRQRPEHWENDAGTLFRNPWPSFHPHSAADKAAMALTFMKNMPEVPRNIKELMPVHKPVFSDISPQKLKATWLGHACFLLDLPARSVVSLAQSASPGDNQTNVEQAGSPSRGIRILFDPVFSERCSPSQWMGPKRFTPSPCQVSDLPKIDAVVISHNHYDHLDEATLRELFKRDPKLHVFAPLGNRPLLQSLSASPERCHILDWWEKRRLCVEVPGTSLEVDLTCTPCQHHSGRGIMDHFQTLWCSWAIEEVLQNRSPPSSLSNMVTPKKVFFAGDTGYRTVLEGADENAVPVCPVFREIGERFGEFDLALVPIGAYEPRRFMSCAHCAPQDSVQLFMDVRAKRGLAMHWGTWIPGTTEPVLEAPDRLREACTAAGLEDGTFVACELGESFFY